MRRAYTFGYVSTESGQFPLSVQGRKTKIYCSFNDWTGVRRAAGDLCRDLHALTGQRAEITEFFEEADIIAGTLGKCVQIDELAASGKINADSIRGEWEAFLIAVADGRLVIAGSDQRGTIFGIYDLCQKAGVSPWYWWADVSVGHVDQLYVNLPEAYIEKGSSVRYRGIFINDEYAMANWAAKRGDKDYLELYCRVYELLLRLKANTLWPAMHQESPFFHENPQNARNAADYGIVIGTSHCEMLHRNNEREYGPFEERWEREHPLERLFKKKLPDSASPCAYVWIDRDPVTGRPVSNKKLILDYWRESVQQFGQYESIFTIGMRGIHDAGWQPEGADSLEEKAAQMEEIMKSQRELLAEVLDRRPEEIPQILIPYKEIGEIYNAGMNVPDDVTLMWSDDNFGYLRQNSSPQEQKRRGRAGIYYHAGYHGDPNSYIWQSNVPFSLMREELCKGYENGADRIWILNVGDLKPAEKQIEFFCSLGRALSDVKEADLRDWISQRARRDFSFSVQDSMEFAEIEILFQQLAFARKPEHFRPGLFQLEKNGDEGQRYAEAYGKLIERSEKLYHLLEKEEQPSFFQLQLYLVRTCGNTARKFIYADKAALYASQGRGGCVNKYAAMSDSAYYEAVEDTWYYNQLCNGKWKWIMDPWQPSITKRGAKLPNLLRADRISEVGYADLGIRHEQPLSFTIGVKQSRFVDLFNTGSGYVEWWIAERPKALNISHENGIVYKDQRLWITVNWDLADPSEKYEILVFAWYDSWRNIRQKEIKVYLNQGIPAGLSDDISVEKDGEVWIKAADRSRFVPGENMSWKIQPNLGRLGNAIKMCREETDHSGQEKIPKAIYPVYLLSSGTFSIKVYRIPTLNERGFQRLTIALDDGPSAILEGNSCTGTKAWEEGVLSNIEILETTVYVENSGLHEFVLSAMDPDCMVEAFVLTAIGN